MILDHLREQRRCLYRHTFLRVGDVLLGGQCSPVSDLFRPFLGSRATKSCGRVRRSRPGSCPPAWPGRGPGRPRRRARARRSPARCWATPKLQVTVTTSPSRPRNERSARAVRTRSARLAPPAASVPGQEEQELLAAPAAGEVGVADGRAQDGGELAEDVVADGVPVARR